MSPSVILSSPLSLLLSAQFCWSLNKSNLNDLCGSLSRLTSSTFTTNPSAVIKTLKAISLAHGGHFDRTKWAKKICKSILESSNCHFFFLHLFENLLKLGKMPPSSFVPDRQPPKRKRILPAECRGLWHIVAQAGVCVSAQLSRVGLWPSGPCIELLCFLTDGHLSPCLQAALLLLLISLLDWLVLQLLQ